MLKFIGFFRIGAITFLAGFSIFAANPAVAQIVAGAVIPLDPAKGNDDKAVAQVMAHCLFEEMKASFVGIQSPLKESVTGQATNYGDKTGTKATWTKNSTWSLYDSTGSMTFKEWTTPTDSVERQLNVNFSSSTGRAPSDNSDVVAQVWTDVGGQAVDVQLEMNAALPYFQTVSTGGQNCSVNNWGRDNCTQLPETITAMNLIVPANFATTVMWMNSHTYHPTQKQFDAVKYGECLISEWAK